MPATHARRSHSLKAYKSLYDGRVPIDNGIVERLHRRPAVGHRIFLFAGSHAAGERATVAYPMLWSCVMVDVNPAEYLADILPKLTRGSVFRPEDYLAMLPAF